MTGVSAAGWLTHDPGQLLVEQQHHLCHVLVNGRAPTARRRRRSAPGKHGGGGVSWMDRGAREGGLRWGMTGLNPVSKAHRKV